jgi:ACT domain-containing protein
LQVKSRKQAILKIEIDRDLYDRYKKIVKSKNQMLKGYNNDLFLNAVRDEIKKGKIV